MTWLCWRAILPLKFAPATVLGRKTLTPAAVRKLEATHGQAMFESSTTPSSALFFAPPALKFYPRTSRLAMSAPNPVRPTQRPELAADTFQVSKRRAIESFERTYVQDLLHTFSGNISRAAREAGKDRRAFGRLARKYGLTQPHA